MQTLNTEVFGVDKYTFVLACLTMGCTKMKTHLAKTFVLNHNENFAKLLSALCCCEKKFFFSFHFRVI